MEGRQHYFLLYSLVLIAVSVCSNASEGDSYSSYRACVKSCLSSGVVDGLEISGCSGNSSGLVTSPWELTLTKWDCPSECKYQCMVSIESKRAKISLPPVKYHGKWPFKRVFGTQEAGSVLFSLLNFLATLNGLSQFIHLVFWKLPRRQTNQRPWYEYANLWTFHGILSLNSWIQSAIFHARDTPTTQAWDYSSAIAVIGWVLIVTIVRTAGLRLEAARVMVSAPIIGFVSTHILYLNFYKFDFGWNITVCAAMGTTQLLLWIIWSNWTKHPASGTVTLAAIGTFAALLLEIFDFPPYLGLFDAHALWHAATVPLTVLWWSFVSQDAIYRTNVLLRKGEGSPHDDKKSN